MPRGGAGELAPVNENSRQISLLDETTLTTCGQFFVQRPVDYELRKALLPFSFLNPYSSAHGGGK